MLPDSTRIKVTYRLADELRKSNPAEALTYIKECLALSERVYGKAGHGTGVTRIQILNLMGVIYQLMSDYPKALSCSFRALRASQAINNVNEQLSELNNIGICYLLLKRYDLSKRYLSDAVDLCLKHSSLSSKLGSVYNNIGQVLLDEERFPESIAYFEKSIVEDEKHQVKDNGNTYANMGMAYTRMDRLDEAAGCYEKALTRVNNDVYHQVDLYHSLGKLGLKKGDIDGAEKYLFRAKSTAESSAVNIGLEDVYLTISKLYEKRGDYRNAALYKDKFIVLKDRLYNERMTAQINEMQVRYETQRKDEEIRSLSKDKEIIAARMEKDRNLKYFMYALLGLLLAMSVIISRNIVLKQRMKSRRADELKNIAENRSMRLMNENISARYEILKSKINPHFLFNSFAMLSSLIVKDPETARRFVKRFSKLYRTMLETSAETLVPLKTEMEFVNDYIHIQRMCIGEYLYADIRTDEQALEAYVPPFSVQMMVENAIKHNNLEDEETLRIDIVTENGYLVVRNNRSRTAAAHADSTGTGQKNIVERYRMLNAGREVKIIEGESQYTVMLPLIHDRPAQINKAL